MTAGSDDPRSASSPATVGREHLHTAREDRTAFAGELTTASGAARASFGAAVHAVLAHQADAGEHLGRALAADPTLVLGHVLKGVSLRTLGRRDLQPDIKASLKAATESLRERGGSPREYRMHAALSAWTRGDVPAAANAWDSILADDPKDLLAIKLGHACRFMMGDSRGLRESLALVTPAQDQRDPGYGYVLGCHAFALEETHDLEAAERAGRRAVELNGDDAWARHAVAHVLLTTKRHAEGKAWLVAARDRARACNNFAGHLAWHEALVDLALGDTRSALDAFDHRIAVYPPRDYRDVSNAVSLLGRLEDHGVHVSDRWTRLAEIAWGRRGDHGLAFADLHYLMALIGAGQAERARQFLASMVEAARAPQDFDGLVLAHVGVPLGETLLDLDTGRATDAVAGFARLRPRIQRIGGSHAQRAVFDWLEERARRLVRRDDSVLDAGATG